MADADPDVYARVGAGGVAWDLGDAFEHCPLGRRHGRTMSDSPPPRRSMFGVASILIPLGVSVVARVVDRNPRLGDGLNGYAGMFLGAFLYLAVAGGCLAGAAMGILAWV